MILNYNVDVSKLLPEKKQDIKTSTKLSMQSTVTNALASKLPQNPVQPMQQNPQTGWGRNS